MRNVLGRGRPSPAMVVAFIALLAALSGTAVALPGRGSVRADDLRTGSVGKRAIRNGSVGKGEARARSVGISELRDGAVTTAKLEHPIYSARVASDGALVRGVGATSATRVSAGSYRVAFEQDVSGCSYQVTPGNVNQNLTAQAGLDGADNRRVFVSLRSAPNGVRTDGDFQVAVFC
jgi:hypothetical protein